MRSRSKIIRLTLTAAATATLVMFVPFASAGEVTSVQEYPTPTAAAGPIGIAAGPDGRVWFTESDASRIGRIAPGGSVSEYVLPVDATPTGIAAGPDGNLWFTEQGRNKVGSITPTGIVAEYDLGTLDALPTTIAAGPDGNLWFTELGGNAIGRITPVGAVTEFGLPTAGANPTGIAAGPDGDLWFTEQLGKIGKITTAGVVSEYNVPTAGAGPLGITAGPDGNLWFTEYTGHKIGKITTAGVVTEYSVPTTGAGPFGITAGPDGNLWFTEFLANKLARITTAGVVTEYVVPTAGSFPYYVTTGPDGNLWFTEYVGNKIGKASFGSSGGDTTPPVLTLPANIAADATSPAGAVVTFTVTATDDIDPNPTVSCSPASGATFAIGATSVSCTATDQSRNTSSRSFVVTVRGAREQTMRLLQEVMTAAGPTPLQRAILKAQLQAVLDGFSSTNPAQHGISCARLAVVAILVSAWSEHPIPRVLADGWRADAHRIRGVLGC